MLDASKRTEELEGEETSFLRDRDRGCLAVAIMVANKVPKGANTTPFGTLNPAELPFFISGLRVDVKTAKPLCAGSIPARASNPPRYGSFPRPSFQALLWKSRVALLLRDRARPIRELPALVPLTIAPSYSYSSSCKFSTFALVE